MRFGYRRPSLKKRFATRTLDACADFLTLMVCLALLGMIAIASRIFFPQPPSLRNGC